MKKSSICLLVLCSFLARTSLAADSGKHPVSTPGSAASTGPLAISDEAVPLISKTVEVTVNTLRTTIGKTGSVKETIRQTLYNPQTTEGARFSAEAVDRALAVLQHRNHGFDQNPLLVQAVLCINQVEELRMQTSIFMNMLNRRPGGSHISEITKATDGSAWMSVKDTIAILTETLASDTFLSNDNNVNEALAFFRPIRQLIKFDAYWIGYLRDTDSKKRVELSVDKSSVRVLSGHTDPLVRVEAIGHPIAGVMAFHATQPRIVLLMQESGWLGFQGNPAKVQLAPFMGEGDGPSVIHAPDYMRPGPTRWEPCSAVLKCLIADGLGAIRTENGVISVDRIPWHLVIEIIFRLKAELTLPNGVAIMFPESTVIPREDFDFLVADLSMIQFNAGTMMIDPATHGRIASIAARLKLEITANDIELFRT